MNISDLPWEKRKQTTHGIVRGVAEHCIVVDPVGHSRGNPFYVQPEALAIELNDLDEAMDESQTVQLHLTLMAARSVIIAAKQLPLSSFYQLLISQGYAQEQLERDLARLNNAGKLHLEGSVIHSDEENAVFPAELVEEFLAANKSLRQAEQRLHDATHPVIIEGSAFLPKTKS